MKMATLKLYPGGESININPDFVATVTASKENNASLVTLADGREFIVAHQAIHVVLLLESVGSI